MFDVAVQFIRITPICSIKSDRLAIRWDTAVEITLVKIAQNYPHTVWVFCFKFCDTILQNSGCLSVIRFRMDVYVYNEHITEFTWKIERAALYDKVFDIISAERFFYVDLCTPAVIYIHC